MNMVNCFNLVEVLGKNWSVWKGPVDGDGLSGDLDIDPRSDALTEFNVDEIVLKTFSKEGENVIDSEERLRRVKADVDFVRFGGNMCFSLLNDYQKNKKNSILELFYNNKKVSCIFFDGLVLRNPTGYRGVLRLYRIDGLGWMWECCWLIYRALKGDYMSAGCTSK